MVYLKKSYIKQIVIIISSLFYTCSINKTKKISNINEFKNAIKNNITILSINKRLPNIICDIVGKKGYNIETIKQELSNSDILQKDLFTELKEEAKNNGIQLLKKQTIEILEILKQLVNHSSKNLFKCNKCAKQDKKMLRCSVCKKVYYCSKGCQKADWKNHKQHCLKPMKVQKKIDIDRKTNYTTDMNSCILKQLSRINEINLDIPNFLKFDKNYYIFSNKNNFVTTISYLIRATTIYLHLKLEGIFEKTKYLLDSKDKEIINSIFANKKIVKKGPQGIDLYALIKEEHTIRNKFSNIYDKEKYKKSFNEYKYELKLIGDIIIRAKESFEALSQFLHYSSLKKNKYVLNNFKKKYIPCESNDVEIIEQVNLLLKCFWVITEIPEEMKFYTPKTNQKIGTYKRELKDSADQTIKIITKKIYKKELSLENFSLMISKLVQNVLHELSLRNGFKKENQFFYTRFITKEKKFDVASYIFSIKLGKYFLFSSQQTDTTNIYPECRVGYYLAIPSLPLDMQNKLRKIIYYIKYDKSLNELFLPKALLVFQEKELEKGKNILSYNLQHNFQFFCNCVLLTPYQYKLIQNNNFFSQKERTEDHRNITFYDLGNKNILLQPKRYTKLYNIEEGKIFIDCYNALNMLLNQKLLEHTDPKIKSDNIMFYENKKAITLTNNNTQTTNNLNENPKKYIEKSRYAIKLDEKSESKIDCISTLKSQLFEAKKKLDHTIKTRFEKLKEKINLWTNTYNTETDTNNDFINKNRKKNKSPKKIEKTVLKSIKEKLERIEELNILIGQYEHLIKTAKEKITSKDFFSKILTNNDIKHKISKPTKNSKKHRFNIDGDSLPVIFENQHGQGTLQKKTEGLYLNTLFKNNIRTKQKEITQLRREINNLLNHNNKIDKQNKKKKKKKHKKKH